MREFQTYCTIESTHFAPPLPADHGLHRLVDAALGGSVSDTCPISPEEFYWGAEKYSLDRSTTFQSLSPQIRARSLHLLTRFQLELSWFIEKTGCNYSSKMMLLSETETEKQSYALIAADEVRHQRLFEHFIGRPRGSSVYSDHPLLRPLAELIQTGNRETLVFVVQILLEGFGMAHYKALRDDCLNAGLSAAIHSILQDEARHHGTGVLLHDGQKLSASDREEIEHWVSRFIDSLQGSAGVLLAIESAQGKPLSLKQRRAVLEETAWEEKLRGRLARMKGLIENHAGFDLVPRLEKMGVFTPKVFK